MFHSAAINSRVWSGMCVCVTLVIKFVNLGYYSMIIIEALSVRYKCFTISTRRLLVLRDISVTIISESRIKSVGRADSAAGVVSGMFAQQTPSAGKMQHPPHVHSNCLLPWHGECSTNHHSMTKCQTLLDKSEHSTAW